MMQVEASQFEPAAGGASNACAGLSAEDHEKLRQAAVTLIEARGVIISLTELVGHRLARLGGTVGDLLKGRLGLDLRTDIEKTVERLLWQFQKGASLRLTDGKQRTWVWFHKIVVAASGATGGFFGAPGLLWDLPITTGLIMRSIADIARTFPEEKLGSDDTRRACIEVFAFGGPDGEDEELDLAYWSTRASLSHLTMGMLLRLAAARFGVAASEKLLAQAIPVAGAVAGAGLNYAFIRYFQQMAQVHFTIRSVERRAADPAAVGACFSALVRELRAQRAPRRAPFAAFDPDVTA